MSRSRRCQSRSNKLIQPFLIFVIDRCEFNRETNVFCFVNYLRPQIDHTAVWKIDLQADQFFVIHLAARQHKTAINAEACYCGFAQRQHSLPPGGQIDFYSWCSSSFQHIYYRSSGLPASGQPGSSSLTPRYVRASHSSGKNFFSRVVRKYPIPSDPPVPRLAPTRRSTILI